MDYNAWNAWKNEVTLANGVKIWHKHVPTETSLVCAIVDAGSRHDGAVPGLAHFTEHMLFQGTKSLPDEQIKFVAAEHGIAINAATSKEFLFVETSSILPGKIDIALDLCKEAIINPTFPKDSFEREKKVVLSEIGDSEDSALRKALESAKAKICKHPFKIPVLGTTESITKASVNDMYNFHQALFTPSRTTVCYAGSLSLKEFTQVCEEKFGNWEVKPTTWDTKVSHDFQANNIIKRPDINQVGVVIAYPGASFEVDDSLKLKALCDIIGGSMVSRMFRKLRNKHGLCYFCGASHQSFFGSPGILAFYGSTGTNNVASFVTGLQEILQDIISVDPITQQELDIAKTAIKSNMLSMIDNLSHYIDMFVYIWEGQNKRQLGKDLKIIDEVSLEDIMRLATHYLSAAPEVFLVGNIPDTTLSTLKLFNDSPLSVAAPSAANVDRPSPAGTSHAAGPNKVNPSFHPGNRKVENMDDVLKEEEDIDESMKDTEPSCVPKERRRCSVCGEEFDALAGVHVKKCPDCKLKDIDFQQPLKKVSIYSKSNECLAEIALNSSDIRFIVSDITPKS